MLNEILKIDAWKLQREKLDIASWNRILFAFNTIANATGTASTDNGRPSGKVLLRRQLPSSFHPDEIYLYNSAMDYNDFSEELGKDAVLLTRVYCFRQLVIGSMCVVMQKQGCAQSLVDEIMRKMLESDHERKAKTYSSEYLQRLRDAALWVNKIIAKLGATLGHRASEIFLLCKLKIPKALMPL